MNRVLLVLIAIAPCACAGDDGSGSTASTTSQETDTSPTVTMTGSATADPTSATAPTAGTASTSTTMTGSTTGPADTGSSGDATDTGPGGGPGFFATFTIDGTAGQVACPGPDDDIEPPYLVMLFAGFEQNVGCALEQAIGATGPVVAINFDDARDNTGTIIIPDGPFDENSAGVASIRVRGTDMNVSMESLFDNFQGLSITGTYDAGTRRLEGSFSASWGPSTSEFMGEGEVSGTFDQILPEA